MTHRLGFEPVPPLPHFEPTNKPNPPPAPTMLRHESLCKKRPAKKEAALAIGGVVAEDESHGVEVLPDDEDLDSTHLERLQCVLHAEAVAPRVRRDLVKVLA